MRVHNVHRRIINQSRAKLLELFSTLATGTDLVWPGEKWPPMRFKHGITEGAYGGHGPIRYQVTLYESTAVEFRFLRPKGFNGIHKLEIIPLDDYRVEIKHTIEMTTKGMGTFIWVIAIRWLHDALIEDAFDKVENQFGPAIKSTEWNTWVKALRKML